MNADRSVQFDVLRRSVGPWISHFERSESSNARSSSEESERNNDVETSTYTRNSQGLIVRPKHQHKRKRKSKGINKGNNLRYDPYSDEKIKGDPHKTIFIARLDYNTTEDAISENLGRYGPIKSHRLVKDTESGKSKGYAFLEFSEASHAKKALRETKDELLIVDGKKVLVDRVRGGVIPSWLPRRLGGGLGQRQQGTQRFTWKLPYFGDVSRIDQEDIDRKRLMWLEHNRRSIKVSR
ncbi:uncharacterized protein [Porites lutea]|uniref:uncharacterized protein n=1 Tax=Porites lutea TaxID=51062 RepID=UPI003CC5EEF2